MSQKQRDAVELRVVLVASGPSRTAAILPMAQPIIAMPLLVVRELVEPKPESW